MRYKALCSDIDGTLLNSERDLSDRLKKVIKRLPIDFPIILASSRMPKAMRHLLEDLDRVNNPLISYNGGFVQNAKGETLESTTIPLGLVDKIYQFVSKTNLHISLFYEDNWYEAKEDYWSKREIQNTKTEPIWMQTEDVLSLWSKKNNGAHKIMTMGDSQEISWLFGELHLLFSKELHLYRSKDTYIEIAPKSISKATALRKILNECYDFPIEEVIAFGDNYNDIDLLQAVGMGIAVANARPELKMIANDHTLHHKEDGVALSIEKYFELMN
ncbi:Cof-type HAD-IIB family hydrolase [Algoriphagus sediminis]|uniref:Cof-type HAD-IIB family hydrolase n=1 Tax=Algoriphagus sediminis TaxID=3057113 RepID=A0ABT7YEY4_9BACT|nr:Cof-type HAD-IIB family hydrolase [Algoriphagus sediminis]MDN3205062.1 Cof-type HAD-IIB family hydrolase [Algoriphagus sediminis]